MITDGVDTREVNPRPGRDLVAEIARTTKSAERRRTGMKEGAF